MRRILSGLVLTLMTIMLVWPVTAAAAGNKVYVLHIDGNRPIDPTTEANARQVFDQAEADPAVAAVAIVIDTPGGYVGNALNISTRILGTKLRTVAFVEGGAYSAGAYVATASEKLYMHPGSVIGAAEPRDAGTEETANYKDFAAWAGAFRSAAIARHRDPAVAQAMIDKKAPIPGQKDQLLVLSADEAAQMHYADGIADSLDSALQQAGVTGYTLAQIQGTVGDQFGRVLTIPWVATLLLVVGVIAVGIEFMKPGVTVPGLVGITCLVLFFLGNILVGTAGWLTLALFLLGIILLVVEAFVPGFGVFGFGGVAAVVASIFMAVPTTALAIRYLTWASVSFLVVLVGIVRAISRRGLGKPLTLDRSARGFVPARADLSGLVGQEGTVLTTLRPAGMAQFGTQKVDVVSEGEFIAAGTRVAVLSVDGARVIVRALPASQE